MWLNKNITFTKARILSPWTLAILLKLVSVPLIHLSQSHLQIIAQAVKYSSKVTVLVSDTGWNLGILAPQPHFQNLIL